MTGTTPIETEHLVREVTDRDFETEVEKSSQPTVVMFYSENCPHCRTILPYVEGFARDFRERIRFVVMDVVANTWTAERYGVRSTPTFKFFCHGRPVQELVGAILPAMIERYIEEFEVHGEECIRSSTEIEYEITGYG
ncbi:MAG: thioredoxin family protein [Methanospirillum sp.]